MNTHFVQMREPVCKVTVYNTQKDLSLDIRECKRKIQRLVSCLDIITDEVIIHFVTEKKIRHLHQLLFDDASVTDCISIPIDPPIKKGAEYHLLGEIFICVKVARNYAKNHNLDQYEEIMRYVIHGLLHLIGYDDIKLKDRRKMKIKEDQCLKLFFQDN